MFGQLLNDILKYRLRIARRIGLFGDAIVVAKRPVYALA